MACQCWANQWHRAVAQPVLAGRRPGTGKDCACCQQVFTQCNPDYRWTVWWKWSQQKRGDFRGVKEYLNLLQNRCFYRKTTQNPNNRQFRLTLVDSESFPIRQILQQIILDCSEPSPQCCVKIRLDCCLALRPNQWHCYAGAAIPKCLALPLSRSVTTIAIKKAIVAPSLP